MDLSVDISGIRIKNPVMVASGTFGYGEEYSELIDISQLGAVVTKGTTLEPRWGNPQPRISETPAGMINSIGLQNPGIEVVIIKKIPFLRRFGIPIIVNICGGTVEEYVKVARKLNQVEGVSGIEINISCPNTEKGGMAFGKDPEVTYEVVNRVRNINHLPLITKLTPEVTDITVIARAAVEAGTDALSLINTVPALDFVGSEVGPPLFGGESGPAIRVIAQRKVWEVAHVVDVPIIGMGGITDLEDALKFFRAGATAIAVGTALFRDPRAPFYIIKGLKKYLERYSLNDIQELFQFLRRR